MNKKSAVAIGVIGVLAAFAAGLIIMLCIFLKPAEKTQEKSPETTRELVTEMQEPETIVVVETTQVFVEPSEKDNEEDNNNNNNNNNSNNNSNNSNNSNNNGSSSGNENDIEGDKFYIVYNTPGKAGLVMRDAPSKDSEKLGVAPEGTRVYVYSDDTSNNTGYVRVLVSFELYDVNCYVLKDYLKYDSEGFYGEADSGNKKNAHVSYNTPNNAGLNLREEASSSSELICVIESGENVRIADGKIVNGYIRVFYDHPHAGDVYEGWLLEKYLIY